MKNREENANIPYPVRINRYLALTGISTRKEADSLIEAKKVKINGRVAVLGEKIGKNDVVTVEGRGERAYSYIAYYKPRGVLTHSAKKGEKDIASNLSTKGLFPVGRLDKDSEGLVILTNDARITDRLLNPKYAHEKEYEVTVDKQIRGGFETSFQKGIVIEGYKTKKSSVKVINSKKFYIILTEGKKHQIRRMCAALGYQVQSLKRIRVANINLGTLAPNQSRPLTKEEQKEFLDALSLE